MSSKLTLEDTAENLARKIFYWNFPQNCLLPFYIVERNKLGGVHFRFGDITNSLEQLFSFIANKKERNPINKIANKIRALRGVGAIYYPDELKDKLIGLELLFEEEEEIFRDLLVMSYEAKTKRLCYLERAGTYSEKIRVRRTFSKSPVLT